MFARRSDQHAGVGLQCGRQIGRAYSHKVREREVQCHRLARVTNAVGGQAAFPASVAVPVSTGTVLGVASALIILIPLGVPQPVQRSYPATAKNMLVTVALVLQPTVMS